MKRWSHHHQSSDHSDDWVDGSWTVDCICGVTYDDGDEMVDCDECGVWVHTRCSRYVKGENMFVCDKCNGGKEIRVLRDVSMEERVHVQGVPGGNRAMFDGLSAVFTPELWMSAGYVPKRFSFRYREFPWWDDENVDVRIGDGGCDRKMGSKKMKWEGEDLDVMYAQNVWKNERSLHDRNKEDVNGKKRARAADKDLEVKKKGGHTLKTVFTSTDDAKQLKL